VLCKENAKKTQRKRKENADVLRSKRLNALLISLFVSIFEPFFLVSFPTAVHIIAHHPYAKNLHSSVTL
jgi:hypothetical protein